MASQAASTFEPLRNRLFLAYWLTALVANFGWLIQVVGASWLMTSIEGSPEQVALVQTSLALPVMLFSLLAGAAADNFGRQRVVMVAQAFLLVISIALAVFSYFGWMTPWILLGFTFLVGTGKAMSNPGWQTMVNEFMPREQLPAAIALNSVGFNMARSVGPMVGGIIVGAAGAFAAFLINALSNVGMLLVLFRWKGEDRAQTLPRESLGSAMMAGIRYVAMSPHILLVMLRGGIFNFAAISITALLPLTARDLLGGGPQTYGLLLGAFGIGAIAGAMGSGRLRLLFSFEGLTRLGFVGFGGGVLLVVVNVHVVLSVIGVALCGASWLLTLSGLTANVQMSSPRWVVSRCHALFQTACFGGNALGSFVWGVLAANIGLAGSLALSALALLLGALVGLRFPLQELDMLAVDPHGTSWTGPDIALDVLPRSGPILTMVEYVIAQENEPAFLAAMAERRRVRIRNGARRWGLARDMVRPQCWIEHYQTPTWVETERLHERRTKADADLADLIRGLHQGPERPAIRYCLDRQAGWFRPDDPNMPGDINP
ncbi:MFS transporter [Devosia sp.]|uniref:MFS transporter n=1 Tax=Devosia sp. TaxID=1871048 RepID=UPI002AFF46C0|nr:MFS transporter [Devosia sp.]